jgi:DMSO/TMAO reductase YedYZ molybdopterin-dependent catalytic subunit
MSEQGRVLGSGRTTRLRLAALILVAGLALIVAAALLYTKPWQGNSSGADSDWRLTLVGRDGDQRVLSLKDVKAMPASEGLGGFFTTTGQVRGPFQVKGVGIEALCDLVGGIGESDLLFVSAADNYSSVFDHGQVSGDLPAYDPVTMKEVPHQQLELILIYEQNGKRLSADDGKPLRLAIVGRDSLLTEGFYWVRWVNRIEVIRSD